MDLLNQEGEREKAITNNQKLRATCAEFFKVVKLRIMEEENKKISISTIIISALAIIIILALAFLFYYYSVKSIYLTGIETASVSGPVSMPAKKEPINPTNVIFFKPSEVLPKLQKKGDCFASSKAEPFRADAFRCKVLNEIYDPCFTTDKTDIVFCQVNPLAPEAFLIKLTKPLPEVFLPEVALNNWAWFMKLRDGTYCSPFTGTRPVIESQVAYYGCSSDIEGEQVVLMGDLIVDDIWTANKAVLSKEDNNWIIKSSEQVEADTVWQ